MSERGIKDEKRLIQTFAGSNLKDPGEATNGAKMIRFSWRNCVAMKRSISRKSEMKTPIFATEIPAVIVPFTLDGSLSPCPTIAKQKIRVVAGRVAQLMISICSRWITSPTMGTSERVAQVRRFTLGSSPTNSQKACKLFAGIISGKSAIFTCDAIV